MGSGKMTEEGKKMAKERMAAWWDHEIIDRPVIAYSYRKFNLKKSADFDRWYLAKNLDDFSFQHRTFMNHVQNRYYGGEQFPMFWPNYGPGIMAAVLGITPKFQNGTMWFDKPTDINEIEDLLEDAELNRNNPWYARLCDVTQFFVEQSKGKYMVGMTDLGGVLDILSSFLGPKDLIVNMRRNPSIIDACRAIILEK